MSKIDKAFQAIRRADFLPEDIRGRAHVDVPLPIGYGQTNSQPTTVRWMLEWLNPRPGQKILDVGSGSGWASALLGYLVGPRGSVYAVEKIPQLVALGAENCKRAGVRNVRFFAAGSAYGLPGFAPYDRILVSAAATELPPDLFAQLKPGGRMVIPIKNSVWILDKIDNHNFSSKEEPGFRFVPLVETE